MRWQKGQLTSHALEKGYQNSWGKFVCQQHKDMSLKN